MTSQSEWLDELEAQLEDLGVDRLFFMLDDGDEVVRLNIQDVSYNGNHIIVKLGVTK